MYDAYIYDPRSLIHVFMILNPEASVHEACTYDTNIYDPFPLILMHTYDA